MEIKKIIELLDDLNLMCLDKLTEAEHDEDYNTIKKIMRFLKDG